MSIYNKWRPKELSEKWIIGLIGAIQFVNVLDFMMVMPLGPDFAAALDIPLSKLGLIGGSYTAAAAVGGIVGSFFLDRFDRRKALFFAMLGLAIATVLGGFAVNLETLLAARVLAGLFGGPATSLSLSVIADTVPPARRGRAVGAVMGAFSMASIFGVPAGLELARLGGWRLPFFTVGIIGLVVTMSCLSILPPLVVHLKYKREVSDKGFIGSLLRTDYLLSFLIYSLAMFGAFILIPNLSAYYQYNLEYPREHLGLLYFIGGIVSLFAMRIAGRIIDKTNNFNVVVVMSGWFLIVLYFGFIHYFPGTPPLAIFVGFMLAMSTRNVAVNSLSSRVPLPAERARFMSIQSAVQHLSSATGAMLSSQFLTEAPDKKLIGIPRLAMISVACTIIIPLLVKPLENKVRQRERKATELKDLARAVEQISEPIA